MVKARHLRVETTCSETPQTFKLRDFRRLAVSWYTFIFWMYRRAFYFIFRRAAETDDTREARCAFLCRRELRNLNITRRFVFGKRHFHCGFNFYLTKNE